jgi:putative membrane-bound dehydrogenase-like protein
MGIVKRGFWTLAVAALAVSGAAQSGPANNKPTTTIRRDRSGPLAGSVDSFQVRPGFRVELVATDPMVVAPQALAFDERGRLYVAEMRGDPGRGDASPRLGRIRLLEDPDEEGVYQSSTTFAEDLALPSALACWDGGVFVGAAPDILYLKCSSGEGGADVRKVVLTGFGPTNNTRPEAVLHSFQWGQDGLIHGASGGLGGTLSSPGWTSAGYSLSGTDFAFDPKTLAVYPETGLALTGMCFDEQGHRFSSGPVAPLRVAVYEHRYAARNPYYIRPAAWMDLLGPATPLYLPSGKNPEPPDKPANPNSKATNSPAVTWMTNAQGCIVYRGNAFPSNYLDNVFLALPNAHAIHRAVLHDNGTGLTAERAADEKSSEFLTSREPEFHPVEMAVGPDGALYIADRRDGLDRGRIYRVVPENFKRPKLSKLARTNAFEVVSALAHPNRWQRDTAARLIAEQKDPQYPPLLLSMLSNSRLAVARKNALHALANTGSLKEEHLLKGLRDADPMVREHAVLLTERLLDRGFVPDAIWEQLRTMVADPAFQVRCQLALTLGEIRRPDRIVLLGQVLSRDLGNPWMQSAVLSSVGEGAGNLFVLLIRDGRFRSDATAVEFLRQVAIMVGVRGRLDETAQVVDLLAHASLDRWQLYGFLSALGEGLHRTRSSLVLVDPQGTLQPIFAAAFDNAIDTAVSDSLRIAALRLLGVSPFRFTDLGDWLLLICNPPAYPSIQSVAVEDLAKFDDPLVMVGLLERWPGMHPLLRNQAVTALLCRRRQAPAVLDAIRYRKIPPGDLAPWQLNWLRYYPDAVISQRAQLAFGPSTRKRAEIVGPFRPALTQRGSAERGREIFRLRCAECHAPTGVNRVIGTELSGVRARGREWLLSAILEPNQEVAAENAAVIIETKDNEVLVGLRLDENETTLTLGEPRGTKSVWPKLNVQSIQVQDWSFMPEGLERGFSVQDMTDLLDYLMTGAR